MCGIAGIISFNPQRINVSRLRKMSDTLIHRGPEGEGFWINETTNVGLCHRRLCIIDLSDAGAQPMHYLDRYTMVYNGEIYNYIELKETLRTHGYHFYSQTDTEVILAAYDYYGKDCLDHFDGMFAFALWDEKDKTLLCARDRFGEKPFYYYKDEDQFLFASEMKALWAAGVPKKMEDSMLLNYLTLGYTASSTDATATFYKNIFQIAPSHYLLMKFDEKMSTSIASYWDVDKETSLTTTPHEAIEHFADLLHISIKRRLRSDVAVGTSLSGGLDSSSIAAIMQHHLTTTNTHKAFSAIFPGFDKNESKQIELVAKQLAIESFTITPSTQGFIKDLDRLIYHHEEPFESSSMYAQYKVYKLAKEHGVTVLLDGQGADETLAGYHKYYHWYWQELISKFQFSNVGKEIRAAKALGVNTNWSIKNYASAYLPGLTAKKLTKKALLQQKSLTDLNKDFFNTSVEKAQLNKPVVDKLNDILYFDTMQFGLQQLLRYADRNSMAHSREVRLPFLNHELVQFIFSLPSHYKIKDGWTKWILRQTMNKQLPQAIVWRKDKIGFEPPQKQWMKQPQLQEYIHQSKTKLINKGVVNKAVLDKAVQPKSSNEADNFDFRYLIAGLCC